jgi:hypothetical protein
MARHSSVPFESSNFDGAQQKESGVGNGNRTRNRRSHSPVLCQLSYSHRRLDYSNCLRGCQKPAAVSSERRPSVDLTLQPGNGSTRNLAGASGWRAIHRRRQTRNYRAFQRERREPVMTAARARTALRDWRILRSQILGRILSSIRKCIHRRARRQRRVGQPSRISAPSASSALKGFPEVIPGQRRRIQIPWRAVVWNPAGSWYPR